MGKTTLVNAINNGKLEGWPTELCTKYVDSESNVDLSGARGQERIRTSAQGDVQDGGRMQARVDPAQVHRCHDEGYDWGVVGWVADEVAIGAGGSQFSLMRIFY